MCEDNEYFYECTEFKLSDFEYCLVCDDNEDPKYEIFRVSSMVHLDGFDRRAFANIYLPIKFITYSNIELEDYLMLYFKDRVFELIERDERVRNGG
jgi:hypothetical protein